MKKFNWLILIAVLMYILTSSICTYALQNFESESKKEYIVDINRIMDKLSVNPDVTQIDYSTFPHIESILFLDEEVATQSELESFYNSAINNTIFQPFFDNEERLGTLKFIYIASTDNLRSVFFIVQASLFSLMGVVCIIIIYLKQKIVKPFVKLSDMPNDLAQGHFKDEVKVDKNSYIGNFLWGMSQLKDALQVSKYRQYELEKEKKQLLLSISHDIKTPLNMIKLYAKALEDDVYENSEDKLHASQQIDEKCNVIETYVNEIMKQSREDIIDIEVEMGEFYLADLMKKVLSAYQEQCDLRHIDLQVDAFENRILNGDVHRSQEVLENLFENAFKYGDGRTIHISFYEEEYCQLIRFHNSGEAVQDQECTHLFDSFYRGSNAQGIQGNGLGLYICKNIMRKMDGDIFWEASVKGMAFVLVFR